MFGFLWLSLLAFAEPGLDLLQTGCSQQSVHPCCLSGVTRWALAVPVSDVVGFVFWLWGPGSQTQSPWVIRRAFSPIHVPTPSCILKLKPAYCCFKYDTIAHSVYCIDLTFRWSGKPPKLLALLCCDCLKPSQLYPCAVPMCTFLCIVYQWHAEDPAATSAWTGTWAGYSGESLVFSESSP